MLVVEKRGVPVDISWENLDTEPRLFNAPGNHATMGVRIPLMNAQIAAREKFRKKWEAMWECGIVNDWFDSDAEMPEIASEDYRTEYRPNPNYDPTIPKMTFTEMLNAEIRRTVGDTV